MEKELTYYCQQDINILKEAYCIYRNQITKMTQQVDTVEKCKLRMVNLCIDPFQYITLASLCMAMYSFVSGTLDDSTSPLPLSPENYHRQKKRFLTPFIQWLMYISERENIQI